MSDISGQTAAKTLVLILYVCPKLTRLATCYANRYMRQREQQEVNRNQMEEKRGGDEN